MNELWLKLCPEENLQPQVSTSFIKNDGEIFKEDGKINKYIKSTTTTK